MREVELWRRLEGGERSPAIAAALAETVAWPANVRAPFLRFVAELSSSDEAGLRVGALALLSGCRGVVGLRVVVKALDDPDAHVRRAAVAALAATATVASHRYVHALFHRNVDVRRTAVELAPPEAVPLTGWLRADPELRELVRGAPWPSPALDLVDDLWRRDALDPAHAVAPIAAQGAEEIRAWARRTDRRGELLVSVWIATALGTDDLPPIVGDDGLDRLLEILLRAGEAAHACWGPLTDALIVPDDPALRLRTVVAIVRAAERVGWSTPAIRLAIACDARVLALPGVPFEVRRRGLDVLWSQRDRIGSLPAPLVDGLLAGPLARDDDGAPALAHAAAIASLAAERRVRAIVDAFGEPAALGRSLLDPIGWDAVCRLPVETAHLWWLDRLASHGDVGHRRACAIACARWARSSPATLDEPLSPLATEPTGVVLALLQLGPSWPALDADTIAALVPVLLPRLDDDGRARVLAAALACVETHDLAHALLGALATAATPDELADLLDRAGPEAPGDLLRWLGATLTIGEAQVASLATRWLEHGDPNVRAFAARMMRSQRAVPSEARPPVVTVYNLAAAERDAIATCDDDVLEAALALPLALPCRGLCEALARRPAPAQPQLSVCVALLACIDGFDEVSAQLARFGADDEDFIDGLRIAAATMWRGSTMLPPLADAFLVAWPEHVEAFATWLEAEDGGWGGALRGALALPCRFVQRRLWEATATVLVAWSWTRLGKRIAAGLGPGVVDLLVDRLDTDLGPAAARIIVALDRGRVALAELAAQRARIVALAPSCDYRTHFELRSWLPLTGVPARDAPTRRVPLALPRDERAEIKACSDVDMLARICRDGREGAVHEAALRLLELGAEGEAQLARLLGNAAELAQEDAIVESIALWTDPACIARVRALVDDEALPAARRYRLALALVERGESRFAEPAVRLAAAVREGDWAKLIAAVPDVRALVEIAVGCSDPTFASAAVEWVLALPAIDADADRLLKSFLAEGDVDSIELRRRAALRLLAQGNRYGLPVLFAKAFDAATPLDDVRADLGPVLTRADAALADTIVAAALAGGRGFASESTAVVLLRNVKWELRDGAYEAILLEGVDPEARKLLVAERMPSMGRRSKLEQVASAFAWGMLRGRELTGDIYGIHMTAKREDWGHTRMTSRALHVTPLPILRGDRHGRDIVEGLILHEIGHHVWHRGRTQAKVWKRASKDGLFPLLNLVADEHLERNLRSIAAEFGDRIKRLDAYAFQHAARDVGVERLLGMLLGAAVLVLPDLDTGVAYSEDSVRVDSGRLLAELDRRGHPFARFVRALRMGLGNRSGDPRVEAALALFKGGFRNLDMNGLYKVTQQLAEMFGSDVVLCNGFGGHESIEWDERDAAIHGEGISDADVQREVERILEPPRGGSHMPGGGPRRLQINVGGDAGYNKITQVQPLAPQPAVHRAEAGAVARHALRLRETLMRLGLAAVPSRGRLRGRSFDRTRTRAVVLRGDPHMLVAREISVKADLFVGVLIDCSGSMTGDNIARAKRFGVLVAEAARGLPGVDARFFGFTDRIVYEAGDARRCAVTSLQANGGNNDAGALDYVAQVAAKSMRRAKLLVMVSDGLPTECSVAALKGVVQQLSGRHKMCCAQVAVRELEERCFPHYVVLDDANLDLSVRRFGDLIGRLVGRAITG